jgi:hypothetical protein
MSPEALKGRSMPLLAVENNMLGIFAPGVPVDFLARERGEVFPGAFPQQETANVIVQENGSHKIADVRRLPFKLSLKIRDHIAAVSQPRDQAVQAEMVRFLGILHRGPH